MSSSVGLLQSSNRFGVAHGTWSTTVSSTAPGHYDGNGAWTISGGNLQASTTASGGTSSTETGTTAMGAGKWYWEITLVNNGPSCATGITKSGNPTTGGPYVAASDYCYGGNGNKYNNNAGVAYGSTYTNADVIGIAFDNINSLLWFSKNGVWQASATITEVQNGTSTNKAFSTAAGTYYASFGPIGSSLLCNCTANFGGSNFVQTCPIGFTGLY